MRNSLVLIFTSCILCSFARNADDDYRFVAVLMDRVAASPEWADNIPNTQTGMPFAVRFPTVDELLASVSNSVFSSWSLSERRAAFDSFLAGLAHTNRIDVGRGYESTGECALLFCDQVGYTNALQAAVNVLAEPSAPCRDEALKIAMRFMRPSERKNLVVLSVATNKSDFTVFRRHRILDEYVSSLNNLAEELENVRVEAAKLYYSQMANIENLIAVDKLLIATFPAYTTSSNRENLCLVGLCRQVQTEQTRAYFTSITNRLGEIEHPLQIVPELQSICDSTGLH